ncbi:hypothetical protein Dsin_032565 [Dipteronia sinensis]|uniref:Myb/SANT-like DNA-binding domain-containing protein n=1 Tax=Dipteronia sinensis TaxID=43782 RepID=A0AAE0DL52_9ROSI|nr:hypothetical protein Dsin_032565 [Dipteronia sinensis]
MIGNFNMSDRRNWTLEEEDVMISILEGIVADGGRCDTGRFRPGTYEQVASKMREKIENITLTAKHVQNKMKRMKDRYSAAYDMLNTSSMAESAADALDHMGLENDEPDTFGFTQPMSTPSNVASASSDPSTEQTSKRKRKRTVSSAAADIAKVAMYFGNSHINCAFGMALNDSYKPDFVKAILDDEHFYI